MTKYVLKLLAAVALMTVTLGISQAQASDVFQAQARPRVTIYNNSNQNLVFNLRSAYSSVGRYRIGPRQTRTLFCNCPSTPHFIVSITTAGRGAKRYTLYPGRRYQLKWDPRIGLWNIFTMRAAAPPPTGRGPRVTLYNNSNQSLVFNLRSAYSSVGRYRIGPRQTRTLFCNCPSTPHFIVSITTAGRGAKRYTLYPGRRYQMQWDPRIGLWNIFTMRAGGLPPGGGGGAPPGGGYVPPPGGGGGAPPGGGYVPPGGGGGVPPGGGYVPPGGGGGVGPGGPGRPGRHYLVLGACPQGGFSRGSVGFANVGRNDRNEGAPNYIRISLCTNGRGRGLLLVRGRSACGGQVISRTRFQNVANSDFNEGAPNFVRLVLCQVVPLRRAYQITTRGCNAGLFPRSRVRFKNVGNSDFNEGAPNFVTVRLCVG